MDKKHSYAQGLLTREDCILVVIDVQEKLMPAIANREKVIDNIVRLLKFSRIIGLPVILTEQQKIGPTLPEVKREIPELDPVVKISFDCFSCQEFGERVSQIGRKTLLLTGIETHVCVTQTALHALPEFTVHVVGDAVSSRDPDNKKVALKRMRQSGGVITSTEMVIFELLQRAGTDEFREALQLVK